MRLGTDPKNKLREDTVYREGDGTYKPTSEDELRWGDYSGTAVDPINDIDLWTVQQYSRVDGYYGTWWKRLSLAIPNPEIGPPVYDRVIREVVARGPFGGIVAVGHEKFPGGDVSIGAAATVGVTSDSYGKYRFRIQVVVVDDKDQTVASHGWTSPFPFEQHHSSKMGVITTHSNAKDGSYRLKAALYSVGPDGTEAKLSEQTGSYTVPE